jgi:DUF4097 and DUF4098 domain-containing protein YvlB
MKVVTACCLISLLILGFVVIASGDDKDSWDVSDVKRISIDGVSGDVIILPVNGRTASVELEERVRPAGVFDAVVERRGNDLDIEEEFHGNSSGPVRWTIYLSKEHNAPTIKISNASGDLECTDVTVGIRYQTASGDVMLSNVTLESDSKFNTASRDIKIRDMSIRGDSRFSTASGNVELDDVVIEADSEFSTASGDVVLANCVSGKDARYSSASGDIEVQDTKLEGESRFSSSSGDVELYFERLPGVDFTASSSSGDVTLKVDDFGEDFTLVIEKRKDKGRISCPFKYTGEEEFRKNDKDYVRKIVERGSGRPVVKLSTASGSVKVKD